MNLSSSFRPPFDNFRALLLVNHCLILARHACFNIPEVLVQPIRLGRAGLYWLNISMISPLCVRMRGTSCLPLSAGYKVA